MRESLLARGDKSLSGAITPPGNHNTLLPMLSPPCQRATTARVISPELPTSEFIQPLSKMPGTLVHAMKKIKALLVRSPVDVAMCAGDLLGDLSSAHERSRDRFGG